ncbi:MAG: 2-iminoacetate synthase ThiH [Cytophagales bacterium]
MNNSFEQIFHKFSWEQVKESILAKTSLDVEFALNKTGKRNLEDFKALISPAAIPYLEQMAQLSHMLTKQRFGNTMQLFVPLYLSNECKNICTYCGFSVDNPIKRTTLNPSQIQKEIDIIKAMNYEHVLLVTGEDAKYVGVEYIRKAIVQCREYFAQVSMEVQPLEEEEYKLLVNNGLHSVLVYQETYHENMYKTHHPKGKKSNFLYRLDTPDRLGRAGVHKIGLGVLIGLEDWRTDTFFCALHLDYLEKTYWQTKYSLSFPRLRPYIDKQGKTIEPFVNMSDKELVQLICAYRIFNQELELSLSTRESEVFRNNVHKLGITSMSAGSKTNPGGYSDGNESLEQFEISDERTPQEIATMLKNSGYEPVWKDWDMVLQS